MYRHCSVTYSIDSSRMCTVWIIFSYVSSVSAFLLNPDLLRLPPSNTTTDNVSTGLQSIQSPWHTSNVLRAPRVNINTTDSPGLQINRQLQYACSDFLGRGPYTQSCEDAARNMAFIPPGSAPSQVLWWGKRGLPVLGHVPLPQEVVSCERLSSALKEGLRF